MVFSKIKTLNSNKKSNKITTASDKNLNNNKAKKKQITAYFEVTLINMQIFKV